LFRQLSNEPRQQIEKRTKDEPDSAEGRHYGQHAAVTDIRVVNEAPDKAGQRIQVPPRTLPFGRVVMRPNVRSTLRATHSLERNRKGWVRAYALDREGDYRGAWSTAALHQCLKTQKKQSSQR
jgi:hypothetical protein